MDRKQLFKHAGVAALLLCSILILIWSFTRSDLEPLDLSKATLKGKVTYKGKPVASAMIIVATDRGNTVAGTGLSDASGVFFVPYAPTGLVKIGVNTDAGSAMMRGASIAAAMSGDKSAVPATSNIPKKYHSPDTSGIVVDLKNVDAENTFNIDLK